MLQFPVPIPRASKTILLLKGKCHYFFGAMKFSPNDKFANVMCEFKLKMVTLKEGTKS